jgi:hypothetical protein
MCRYADIERLKCSGPWLVLAYTTAAAAGSGGGGGGGGGEVAKLELGGSAEQAAELLSEISLAMGDGAAA